MTAERLSGGEGMKYTEKIHAKRLLGMLNKKNPCLCCPREKHYLSTGEHGDMPWDNEEDEEKPCLICMDFISIKPNDSYCPCYILGEQEAIKRTWLALEEKGYLD